MTVSSDVPEERTATTAERFVLLFCLVFAGEMIYSLPFHVPRYFRPTVLEVFGFSNTQLGDVFVLYGVFAMRTVHEYGRYFAFGSGSEYALGALEALYERTRSARQIAEAALAAACRFDDSSALPMTVHTVRVSPNAD